MRRTLCTVEQLERRCLLAVTPGAAIGAQPIGALTGRIIYTSGGHGFTAANTTTGNWFTQRPNINSMVEDIGNQDQMTQLVYYAFNAGATIVPMRPVGHQPNEVVLDNISSGVTFTGSWSDGGAPAAGLTVAFFSLTGPNVASRYRFSSANANETAVARYTPNIPQAGFYPVYAWAQDGGNRVLDQTYRITHSGGATEVKVNHQRVGRGWVYLGTYHFNAGTSGYLEISNRSSSSGVVIADAVRFGNGMGDITRGGGTSGQTREDEASLYWIQKQAENTYQSENNGPFTQLPASTYRGMNLTDSDANVGAPPRWATYMNRSEAGTMTDRLFLSYHSNAGGGFERGTIGLYNGNNDPATKTPNQQEWALLVAREVNDDLVALSPLLEHNWFNRATALLTLDRGDIEFGEINNLLINNEFDATILEVAFHDNVEDAQLMRDPKVRQWIARSSVQGAVRYFSQFGGGALNLAPDLPSNVRAQTQPNGDIELTWAGPVASGPTGGAATGYIIETSLDGYGFDGGIVVPGGGTTYTIPASQLNGDAYYFRVIATNAGGASLPSTVVGARKNPFGKSTILIVNGFDRFDRFLNPRQTAPINGPGTSSTFDRVRPRFSNSFDYVVQAGEAIGAYSVPLGFDSCQNEAIISGHVVLSNYDTVIWLCGEESTANKTFDAAEQALVAAFINNGGHFFVSGAEVGFDLVSQGGGPSFYTDTLRTSYVSDDANTYNVSGAAGSIFAGLSLSFDDGTQFYNVDFPDRIGAANGSTVAMIYVGGAGGNAAVQWSGANNARIVNFGFPFETITTAANRAAVMSAVLTYFGVGVPAAPGAPDLLAAFDTGTSPTDNITRLNNSPGNTLQFTVHGTASGATVSIFADGILIGSTAATSASITVTTDGATPLADGLHAITAVQSVSGQPPSAPSTALVIRIDTAAPTISNPGFAFETSHALSYQFSENVSATLAVGDLTLTNLTTSQTIPTGAISLAYNFNLNRATFTFSGQPNALLPDGNYRATLTAAGITDLAGNPLPADHVLDFFVLAGDANHDRSVDVADLGILASNWQQSPRTFSQGDFDYNGVVDVADLGILASKWQTSLAAPSAAAASPAPRARAPVHARIIDELI